MGFDQYQRLPFRFRLPGGRKSAFDKIVTTILALVVLAGIVSIAYVIVTPYKGEKFTEFYLLGESGMAGGYPKNLTVGQQASVMVGIVNREGNETSYRVEVIVAGTKVDDLGPIVLADGERWEGPAEWEVRIPGEQQKVEFILYAEDSKGPLLEPLHIWVDVVSAPELEPENINESESISDDGALYGIQGDATLLN